MKNAWVTEIIDFGLFAYISDITGRTEIAPPIASATDALYKFWPYIVIRRKPIN